MKHDKVTRKHTHLRVPVLPEEKALIEKQAKAAGRSVAAYLRALGMGYEVGSILDACMVGDLVKINADQGRLGGLLKMWLTNDERFAGFEEAQMRRTIGVVLSKIEETQQALLQLAMKVYGDDDENFSG
ncbi:conjugal transfer transcriptional regulator TraJ [Pseudomonas aeruginosa]|uniref:Conjugal transfer relaxosome component TraJ n=1 Tax=Ectopseudomonas guguanensis TaxID=1198456 RepID=A0A1H0XF40_9GAMM|nr:MULTISPECIES: conjugal transfer transcriptional regulator TraJ [Pseudomonas]EKU8919561.1 conjugal transfer transcriptional regulator TraJ [Pseudomonas aeruginosa]EKU9150842.1 conjugal transfer transcriptional regulator TraJ [Pseudomonas aeruginosa]EKW2386580.1 conjugal transfer transcriptional regulator TraJ [Pseudomonas aeruginosa]ELB4691364.1 conjugal transfer transcriptional regulator TraJ [Pseudomonas aeruginosa]MBD1297158.1 conjugal transfer transcriptional regulator TraJ [Pseudomonas 